MRSESAPIPDRGPTSPHTTRLPGRAPASTVPLGRDLWDLTKPRLTGLVVVTTGVGYWLAAALSDAFGVRRFLATLVGTALVAISSSVLNQWAEREHDRHMVRTEARPFATGRFGGPWAALYALLAGFGGLSILCVEANHLAAGVALVTLLVYVLVYTPLKRLHSLNTIAGAVPGALPPLIGWAAVSNSLPPVAWSLFLILFLWQVPHFLAIALLHREDYARAGFRMLPVDDPDSRRTGRMAVLYALTLVPASLLPAVMGLGGPVYAVGAGLLSLWFLARAVRFQRERTRESARSLFLSSLAYLPGVLFLLCLDPSAPYLR